MPSMSNIEARHTEKNKQILALSHWHHDLQDLPQLLWSDEHWLCQFSKREDTPSTSQVDEEGHEEVGVHEQPELPGLVWVLPDLAH